MARIAAAQLSFYSADVRPPRRADLAGLLCGPGRLTCFATATARLSVRVAERWRADTLVAECAARGVRGESTRCEDVGRDDCGFEVRTPFRADLGPLADRWLVDGVKTVPADLEAHGPLLRLWVLAAGGWFGTAYQLGLDPAAPDTYDPLAAALAGAGLATTYRGPDEGGPGLRLTGRRRMARLAELIGGPPAAAGDDWPGTSLVRT